MRRGRLRQVEVGGKARVCAWDPEGAPATLGEGAKVAGGRVQQEIFSGIFPVALLEIQWYWSSKSALIREVVLIRVKKGGFVVVSKK